MELSKGKVAVVTGAASGIGLALADRFASAGMAVVLADVDEAAVDDAATKVAARGVDTLAVPTDVSDEAAVQALAAQAVERFGAVHVVCNNAGVVSRADPWFGPASTWRWVMGVNFWGVVNGVRAFLPTLVGQGEGHIVNTASMAGLIPGFSPSYDASKHAVVAISEDLYQTMTMLGGAVGVSVLCPGWVRTRIMDAERNWPGEFGDRPAADLAATVVDPYVRRAIDEGMTPAAIADQVAEAVVGRRFWVLPHPDFVEIAVQRWHSIAEGRDPELGGDMPGMPSLDQLMADAAAALEAPPTQV